MFYIQIARLMVGIMNRMKVNSYLSQVYMVVSMVLFFSYF